MSLKKIKYFFFIFCVCGGFGGCPPTHYSIASDRQSHFSFRLARWVFAFNRFRTQPFGKSNYFLVRLDVQFIFLRSSPFTTLWSMWD